MARLRHTAVIAALVVMLSLSASGIAQAAAPGALDPSFGSGGVAALGSGTQFFGVAVQQNGSVVAAGQSGGSVLVERLTAAGQPDASFGGGGQSIGPAGVARAVALQPDGKIVVAGAAGEMFVERLNSDGSADSSFGSGGVAVAGPLGGSAVGDAVAIQPDGKIIVAGSVVPSDPSRGTLIALARFNTNGSPDASFGSGGAEVLDLGLPYASAQGVAVGPDGKIVFAGHEQGSTSFGFFNALVGRINGNGSLDDTFATGGVYSYHRPGGGYDSFNAVTVQNDGKVVAGGADTESNPNALFLRLNSDGTTDTSFGTSGVAALSSGNQLSSTPVGANGVVIAGGGRIVGAGAVVLDGADFRAGLWAVSPSGSPDPSLGSEIGVGSFDQPSGVEGCALAIAPDGSLVTVGDTVVFNRPQATAPCAFNSTSSAFVARYGGFGPPPVAPAPPGPTPPPGPATGPPSATTGSASAVSEVSAIVAGEVVPNGLATSYHLDYGPTLVYGSTAGTASLAAGTGAVGVTAKLAGLHTSTTYHYRLVASNPAGTNYGADMTFKTLPRLSASLRGLGHSYRIKAVLNSGLLLRAGCNQACSITGSLLIFAGAARTLGLGKHQIVIGRASTSLKRAGSLRLRVRLTRAAKTALAHGRKLDVTITLRIVSTPAGGGQMLTFSRTLTLKS